MSAIHLAVRRAAPGSEAGCCVITVEDPDLLGHEAELTLTLRVDVLDRRPIPRERELFRTKLTLDRSSIEIPLPAEALCCYTYKGKEIEIELHARLEVNDGVLFDTKASEEQELSLAGKPEIRDDAEELIEPDDAFDFIANFEAIPPKNRGIVTILAAIALVVIALNSLLGLHDQLAPEEQTFFYSHRDSDGDSQSPLVNSLMGSGVLGALLWAAIRQQLRQYMSFELASLHPLRRTTVLPAGGLIKGTARVDLESVTVRVVAANQEKGQYRRGSGTKERTVSFTKPVRAVLLYERYLDHVPAGVPIESCLDGEVRFEPMFAALYPPLEVGKNHGLEVVWEVQLLHPDFVDQEAKGDAHWLRYEDFLGA